jgi:hypothetical protein
VVVVEADTDIGRRWINRYRRMWMDMRVKMLRMAVMILLLGLVSGIWPVCPRMKLPLNFESRVNCHTVVLDLGPTLYGYYEVWGILRLLAMQPVGDVILEDEEIDRTLRAKMKVVVQRIHDARYVHADITRRNFWRTESVNIFLVDLERCRAAKDQSVL